MLINNGAVPERHTPDKTSSFKTVRTTGSVLRNSPLVQSLTRLATTGIPNVSD